MSAMLIAVLFHDYAIIPISQASQVLRPFSSLVETSFTLIG